MKETQEKLRVLKHHIKVKGKKKITCKEKNKIAYLRRSLERDFDTYNRGKENEKRLLYIVRSRFTEWPHWLLGADDVSRQLDEQEGIDILVKTIKGKVPLNVKSSNYFLDLHYKKYPKIKAFVLNEEMSYSEIYRGFIIVISHEMAGNNFYNTTNEKS